MKRIPRIFASAALALVLAVSIASAEDAAPNIRSQMFDDWVYRCQSVDQAKSVCEVAQEMIVNKDGKRVPILTMALTHGDDGKDMLVNILAPLGVLLAKGLTVSVDPIGPADGKGDIKSLSFSFAYCDQRGCWVSAQKADALAAALKPGKVGHVRVVMGNGRGLNIDFSLAGFANALAAYEAGKPPVEAVAAKSPANPSAATAKPPTASN